MSFVAGLGLTPVLALGRRFAKKEAYVLMQAGLSAFGEQDRVAMTSMTPAQKAC